MAKITLEKCFLLMLALSIVYFCMWTYLPRFPYRIYIAKIREPLPEVNSSAYVINLPNCRIPYFDENAVPREVSDNSSCASYYQSHPDCQGRLTRTTGSLVFVEGQYLMPNHTAIKESGYNWNSIWCCYHVIQRVEESLKNYTRNTDNAIKVSNSCLPIELSTPKQVIRKEAEFITVICKYTFEVTCCNHTVNSTPSAGTCKTTRNVKVLSRDTYLIPHASDQVKNKTAKWSASPSSVPNPAPPSVVILTIDSVSRLNAHRFMPGTVSLLQALGAVEMKGYARVDTSSFRNAVAFLTGYNSTELARLYNYSDNIAQDVLPYIWKAFDKMGYVTAPCFEDSPGFATFQYDKTGFVKKPGDFYIRPGITQLHKETIEAYKAVNVTFSSNIPRCLGNLDTEEVIINYAADVIKLLESLSGSSHVPLFLHAWINSLGHECETSVQYGDHTIAEFIGDMMDLNNTIVVFMADHGLTHGTLRQTLQGWYEAMLPTMWIYLPPRIKEQFPEWHQSLHINSNRLTSHFDLYKTLVHVLREFDKEEVASNTYARIGHQKGATLFEPVQKDRTCEDAGVVESSCPCYEPKNVELDSDVVTDLTSVVIQHVTKLLPKKCAKPVLKRVKSVTTFPAQQWKQMVMFHVSLYTDPGNFLLEAYVKQKWKLKNNITVTSFEVSGNVVRVDDMKGQPECCTGRICQLCYCI